MDDFQAKLTLEVVEIGIAVQETMSLLDAERCYQAIYRAADGDTECAESAIVPCSLDSKRR